MSSTYYLCFNFLAIYNTSGTFSDLRRYEFSFLREGEILCEILPTAYVGRTNIVHESVSRMPLIKFVSTSEERANPLVLIKVSTMKCTSSDTCHLGLTSDFMIFLLCVNISDMHFFLVIQVRDFPLPTTLLVNNTPL